MNKLVVSALLLGCLTGSVVAAELDGPQSLVRGQPAGMHSTVAAESDCCWDKVDFDRPAEPYTAAQGPDCCWVPVWGETDR